MLLEDVRGLVVEVDAGRELGLELAHELEGAAELLLGVEADRGDVLGQDVAQEPLHERRLAVEQGGSALAGGDGADLVPGASQVAAVPLEVLARSARSPRCARSSRRRPAPRAAP